VARRSENIAHTAKPRVHGRSHLRAPDASDSLPLSGREVPKRFVRIGTESGELGGYSPRHIAVCRNLTRRPRRSRARDEDFRDFTS
jgi:hypothetical protein